MVSFFETRIRATVPAPGAPPTGLLAFDRTGDEPLPVEAATSS